MIAVVGSAKEVVKIVMKDPVESGEAGDGGFVDPASVEPKEEDSMLLESSGCGANIAVNLASLGYETEFISAIGDDSLGVALKDRLDKAGVNTGGVKVFPGMTAVNVDFMNILGDLQFTRRNSAMIKNITPELLQEKKAILDKAEIIVVDGSIPREAIEYMAEKYGARRDVKLFYDPALMHGGYKAREVMGKFHCVLPGRMEAEAMTKKTVLSEEQLKAAGAFFHEKGIEKVVITIKGGGLYYKEGASEGILRPERILSFGNTSGAGDVVSAAVIAGTAEGKTIEEIAGDAMAKAAEYLADRKDEKLV